MLRKIETAQMGRANRGWLKSIFHFSFAEYYNPKNMNFGVLRVVNDDIVESKTGFDTHPHKDMEIISYVVDGYLTHGDSMGNENTITRGHVQYMSAGTGVYHSEYNLSQEASRFLQIWIVPDAKNHSPQYGDHRFDWDLRKNKWLHLVSPITGDAPINIHQDANIFVSELSVGHTLELEVKENRQVYLIQIEGESTITGQSGPSLTLKERDSLEIIEESISIHSIKNSHIIAIEIQKE